MSTVRRQSSSVSVESNGCDGPTGFAMLTHHTGHQMRIYIHVCVYISTICTLMHNVHVCSAWVEWLGNTGRGRNGGLSGRKELGKERNRDCPEQMIHKPPSLLHIHTGFLNSITSQALSPGSPLVINTQPIGPFYKNLVVVVFFVVSLGSVCSCVKTKLSPVSVFMENTLISRCPCLMFSLHINDLYSEET